ncbi:lactate utilization protein C [Lysinibacillus telephonicus]|uniref:Lactate utilization protein C n=1 Tax=Lysinibacillus telephonicus TaxID=1714840 RepID=A0A3S0J602_9BACI|nr:lactate utilization protein C [Lysinibacillus telephonicus]RTQ96226.1 lactate utilization protein C [Lysinibacillus telephonicus]
MTIQNRDSFLQTISEKLGRTAPLTKKPEIRWNHLPQHEVLKNTSKDELVQILIEQCQNIHTSVHLCDSASLAETLKIIFDQYGNGSIIYTDDNRFSELRIDSFLQSQPESFKWQPELLEQNITIADQANIGIVISDVTLAESGTIMLQTNEKKGRVISFLPTNSIAIVPKSSIVPRFTQAAQFLRSIDGPVSSCINFITGPSNSADIEMNLVVGVHGPVQMTYVIVEDY